MDVRERGAEKATGVEVVLTKGLAFNTVGSYPTSSWMQE
jgi:hypothetical protein